MWPLMCRHGLLLYFSLLMRNKLPDSLVSKACLRRETLFPNASTLFNHLTLSKCLREGAHLGSHLKEMP